MSPPQEHLALPNIEDMREGVMAARIAAYLGYIINNGSRDQDLTIWQSPA